MENYHISEVIIWEQHEANKLTKETIKKIIEEIHWRNEYIQFLTDESYKIMNEPVIKTMGEANVCVIIAQKKAIEIIEAQNQADIHMDIKIKIWDMLSKLKLESWLLIDPRAERRIIDHYNRPRRLREKFKTPILDLLLRVSVAIAEDEHTKYLEFRKKLFPYLPPYDFPPQ